jgi:hypothetical protein
MPPSQLALDGGMDQASFSVPNVTALYSILRGSRWTKHSPTISVQVGCAFRPRN